MSDLVGRLRDRDAIVMSGLFHAIPAMKEAADEIERLRVELKNWMDIAERNYRESARLSLELARAKDYVNRAIASYDADPPDNNFQRGHLAALEVVRDEAFSLRQLTGKDHGPYFPLCDCDPWPDRCPYCGVVGFTVESAKREVEK